MDIEFIGISGIKYEENYEKIPPEIFRKNFVHELDIAILEYNINNIRPTYKQIYIAAECKDTQFINKYVLKQIIGIRRELSFYDEKNNMKNEITNKTINQNPPVEFLVYSSNESVKQYLYVGTILNIRFINLKLDH